MPSSTALHAYRHVLRQINKHVTCVNNNPLWREYVREQFKAAKEASPERAGALLETTKLYATFLNDIQHHKDLLVSYNISVDAQKRKRQHLASVASKVGLQMPEGFVVEDTG